MDFVHICTTLGNWSRNEAAVDRTLWNDRTWELKWPMHAHAALGIFFWIFTDQILWLHITLIDQQQFVHIFKQQNFNYFATMWRLKWKPTKIFTKHLVYRERPQEIKKQTKIQKFKKERNEFTIDNWLSLFIPNRSLDFICLSNRIFDGSQKWSIARTTHKHTFRHEHTKTFLVLHWP